MRYKKILIPLFVIVVFTLLLTIFWRPAGEQKYQTQLEAAIKKGYSQGYTEGYNTARAENNATYQQGYEAAREEVGRGAFTRNGMTGLLIGLALGFGGTAFLNRKTLVVHLNNFRKKRAFRKAFRNIPSGLPPDVSDKAEHIAHAYANIMEQFRSARGFTVSHYIEQWRLGLKELMDKAVRLMHLIQELETARTNVNEQKLEQTISDLKYTVRRARSDEARNEAIKSLNRAKQTQSDLARTNHNLERCTTSLQGIIDVLESMHLKISNIKVNTQRTELLKELSSDIETEMAALEEAMQEVSE